MTQRRVTQIITAHRQREGGGFIVRRPFPSKGIETLDPLLLLDELGPIDYAPGKAVGAPDHPHRGFETVTYILEGEGAHADSAGNAGTIGPGDVQWMTAGAGVVHREMPSKRIQREGGRVHGFQLWVNLPKKDKRIAPRYQEIPAASIPEVTSDDGLATVRVIAGEGLGREAVTSTHTPILYHHWQLRAGARVELPIPSDHSLAAYIFEGSTTVADESITEGQLAVLGTGTSVALQAEEDSQLLLLGGQPLREPIAWMGPFVMNTEAELREAVEDYQAGRMGSIPPAIIRA
ncbi:MAG: pirin family protein [Myxococcota bacterium]